MRKTDEKIRRQRSLAFHLPCSGLDFLVGGIQAGLTHHVRQHRTMAVGHDRPCFSFQHRENRPRGTRASLVHVDVRVGLVAGDHRRLIAHRREQVGMHVERDADRHPRRDPANAREQFSFAVVMRARHHRSMKVEQYRVATLGNRVHDTTRHGFKRLVVHRRAGRRIAGDREHDLRSRLVGKIDEGTNRGAGALEGLVHVAPLRRQRPPRRETRERRRHRRKGVGLVLHLRDDELHASKPGRYGVPMKSPLPSSTPLWRRML